MLYLRSVQFESNTSPAFNEFEIQNSEFRNSANAQIDVKESL